ncbi:MAG: hypothetical protein ACRDTX_27950 [Pseudonocardiaceae bacterium]
MTDHRAGTLISVNVGLPRDVDWHGRTVHTGVWKRPIDGRRAVHRRAGAQPGLASVLQGDAARR